MIALSQIAAIIIGAFYVFAGVMVLRAMALDRIMDAVLAALNDPTAPKERLRSRVLTIGALLTLASGVALMLLSPLVVWLATQRLLRPWNVPLQTMAIDLAVIVGACAAVWAFFCLRRR